VADNFLDNADEALERPVGAHNWCVIFWNSGTPTTFSEMVRFVFKCLEPGGCVIPLKRVVQKMSGNADRIGGWYDTPQLHLVGLAPE
jgi:hypothetical protein